MKRTLALLLLACAVLADAREAKYFTRDHGAVIRGDTTRCDLALIFTGGDFADGGDHIRRTLAEKNLQAGFFFTGDFYRDPATAGLIKALVDDGHYLGPHSDKHLLYAPWHNRDSSLVDETLFKKDLLDNYRIMETFGIERLPDALFIPPYEWYNARHVQWAADLGVTLFNFTPGTGTHADYTTPDMKNYAPSEVIWNKIWDYESRDAHGLNGFILLMHMGTDPRRTDKFYLRLGDLIDALRARNYTLVRIDSLLAPLAYP